MRELNEDGPPLAGSLGLRVRLTEVGSGPPVLVVPGNTGDGFPFAPLLPTCRVAG